MRLYSCQLKIPHDVFLQLFPFGVRAILGDAQQATFTIWPTDRYGQPAVGNSEIMGVTENGIELVIMIETPPINGRNTQRGLIERWINLMKALAPIMNLPLVRVICITLHVALNWVCGRIRGVVEAKLITYRVNDVVSRLLLVIYCGQVDELQLSNLCTVGSVPQQTAISFPIEVYVASTKGSCASHLCISHGLIECYWQQINAILLVYCS